MMLNNAGTIKELTSSASHFTKKKPIQSAPPTSVNQQRDTPKALHAIPEEFQKPSQKFKF